MSREKVEIVRQLLEGWGSGDFRLGAHHLDQHLVFIVRPDFPEFGVFHGPEGAGEFMSRFLEQWERVTIEAKHLCAVDGTVLAYVVQHGKGRASGIEGDDRYFMLFTFCGKRIVRMEAIMDEAEALEAVGLKDNVEIARRAWEAATRRPKPDFATVNDLYDPAHELVAVMGETYGGAEGYRTWLTEMNDASESWETRFKEATAIDDDRVLLVWTGEIRGRQSGAAAGDQFASIVTVQDGKVTRTETYPSREQALEASGLSKQSARPDS